MILENWICMNKFIVKLGVKYCVGDNECFRSLVDAKEHIRIHFK